MRSRQILRLAQGLRRGLRRKAKALHPAEALSLRPPRRGPAPQGLGWDTNSPFRPRLGSANNLVTSVPTDSPNKTSRPVNAPHYSRNVSRTSALYR